MIWSLRFLEIISENIRNADYPNLEILIGDRHLADDTVDQLRARFPNDARLRSCFGARPTWADFNAGCFGTVVGLGPDEVAIALRNVACSLPRADASGHGAPPHPRRRMRAAPSGWNRNVRSDTVSRIEGVTDADRPQELSAGRRRDGRRVERGRRRF